MASPNQLTGRVIIKKDGVVLNTLEGASLDPGGETREPVRLDNGKIKFRVVAVREAIVKATITDDADGIWFEILKETDVTIVFETDTGVSYKVAPAHSTGEAELTKGEAEVQWFGDPAIKL